MPNAIKWEAASTSRGTVLTTELNSLGNGAYSGVGTEIDNSSNLDQWGCFEINLASLNPTSGAYVQLFITQAVGGTNYEDPPDADSPGTHNTSRELLVTINPGSATKRATTGWVRLPPSKFKVVCLNGTGVAFGASGNTVTLYTDNDEIQ